MAVSLHNALAIDSIRNTGTEDTKAAKMGGWLAAFAAAMGKILNSMAQGLETFAQNIGENPSPSDTTELQMRTQMFSMFMSSVDNALKTMGQAADKAASKG